MLKQIVLSLIVILIAVQCQPMEPTSAPVPTSETAPVEVTATEPSTALPSDPTATPSAPTGPAAPLTPGQIENGAKFGSSVAVDGDTAVVGAPRSESGKGAVYVFVREGGLWRETSRLTADDGNANDFFGHAVAIRGGTIVVGANGQDALGFESGAAYIFQNQQGNWVQTQKLLSSSALDVRFGHAVATDGNTIVVGAPYRSVEAEIINIGSVIVYVNNGQAWEEQTRLESGSGGARSSDLFGWSVAVQDSTIAVGGHLSNVVYLYSLSDGRWQEETVLQGPANSAQFGYSLSLSNDLLAVGAPATSASEARGGAVYLFARQANDWTPSAILSPEGIRIGARFGWSLALQGDLLAVGARESAGQADVEQSGEVYVFRVSAGQVSPVGQFAVPNPAAFDNLGHAIAVGVDFVLVGAPGQDATPGAAYVIDPQ